MKVGINYAWKNYGWDFGLPPKKDNGNAWGARAAWKETIAEDLREFVDLGLFCVRWFLIGDGTTYGTDAAAPHLDAEAEGQWRFDECPPIADEFLDDFDELCGLCERTGIQILPSLLDFHFCFPGIPIPGSQGVIKCGRSDTLIDPQKRLQFMDGVLKPLLSVATAHRSAIYAFEVMNEPEWCTRAEGLSPDLLNPNCTIPLEEMRTFIRQSARHINEAGLLSTVGFAKHPTVTGWRSPELDLTLHQFHFYAEPLPLPPHTFNARWPEIIGEIATAPHRPWPDLGDAQDIVSRLRYIENKGYPVAFLWSANREEEHSADPPAVDYSPENRARIRSYTHGG